MSGDSNQPTTCNFQFIIFVIEQRILSCHQLETIFFNQASHHLDLKHPSLLRLVVAISNTHGLLSSSEIVYNFKGLASLNTTWYEVISIELSTDRYKT